MPKLTSNLRYLHFISYIQYTFMQSLNDFFTSKNDLPAGNADVVTVLHAILLASKNISKNVNRAGLIDILGAAGAENVQGEEQQKLDVIADVELMNRLKDSGIVAAAASEENEEIVILNDSDKGKYVVTFDPLDGSSNIDVNVSIGTIFSIYERNSEIGNLSEKDFLRKGDEQVMAGYVIYGSSTMLVLTYGKGVNAFTLDPDSNEYALSHPSIKTPESGKIYSINEGNAFSFDHALNDYINYCKGSDNDLGKAYSARYIGSMVADIHRNLIKGGIFIYPATKSAPDGKLRMLYECMPMAFLAEQAGGIATSGKDRILDIILEKLHQRSPVIIGSKKMVNKLMEGIKSTIEA